MPAVSRRQFLTAVSAGTFAAAAGFSSLEPKCKALIAITLDLEMSEDTSELPAHVDSAAVTALGRFEAAVREGSRDADLPRLEVNVWPLEREGLAKAHPCPRERKEQGRLPAVIRGHLSRCQERSKLLARHGLDLLLAGRCRRHELQMPTHLVGGIRGDHAIIDRGVEHCSESRVQNSDRAP